MEETDFCWQCPCNCISLFSFVNWSLLIFPLSISFARNSSIKKTFLANSFAASRFSSVARSGYSSLKLRMAEGSIPINGVLSEMIPLSNSILLLAIFWAFLINPLESHALPLSSCFGMITSYPKCSNNKMAVLPICASL